MHQRNPSRLPLIQQVEYETGVTTARLRPLSAVIPDFWILNPGNKFRIANIFVKHFKNNCHLGIYFKRHISIPKVSNSASVQGVCGK